ncbi:hypothetical protein D3C73_1400360 [compost metagenome]
MRQVHDPQLDTGHNTECRDSPKEDIDNSKHLIVQRQREHRDNQCEHAEVDHQ